MPVEAAVLERSLNEVVRRHEVLRTTFEVSDGQPYQVVAEELRLELPVVDARDALRAIAAFRLALPRTMLRFAGGRWKKVEV